MSTDGSLDTAFRLVPPALLGLNSSISAVALQLNGKILASGIFTQLDGNPGTAIFRLNPDGSLDPTFNNGPIQDFHARQIVVLATGKVLVVGYNNGVRLNSDGSLDRSFGLGDVNAVAIQPDGLIIAAGSFAGGVARVFPELNQPGGAEFTVSTFSVPETTGTAVLSVRRLGDTSQETTVDFTTSDVTARAGLDYVAQKGTVRFAPLQVTNALSIAIINDSLVDAEKSFQVTLSNPSSGSALQLARTATVVITSNDIGIQLSSDTFTVNEADGFAEVLVTRNGDGLSAAAVDYSTSDGAAKAGADYLARGGTITFASGETNQTIQIPILDDGGVEGNETIHLALTNPKAGAMLGARTNATLVILDNEIPTLVDPSFDPGKGATDDSGNPGEIHAVAVLPDGKIVVGGFFSRFNGAARSTLARLNPDGTVDAGFRARLAGGMSQMLVQPDGKVLFFYYLNAGSSVPNLSRLGADGTPDASFHSTRFESTPQVGNSYAVILQPDGKILIGGRFDRVGGVAQKNLARLNPDGTLDTTFKVDTGLSTPWNGNMPTIVLQPDGKILISGYFNSINGAPVNGSARLNADGSLDATFSLSDYPGPSLFLAAQPDGKILVQQDGIARVNPDGSKDASFNSRNAYVWYTQFGGYPLALQADGKILFIGTATENDSSRDGLIRLNPNGSLDTTLPALAIGRVDNYMVRPTAFAIQADGKILVAGKFISVNGVPRAGLVRLFGDLSGPPDISFATSNWSVTENGGLAIITVERLGDTSQPASVQYATQDGTALANLNYLPTSGMLDFAPLEKEKTVVVPILDDGLPSADNHLSVILSNPSDGTIINAGVNTTTLTIADSQRPGSVDTIFNPLIETTNAPPSGFHIALQPDGKVIVAGDFQRVNGVSRNRICRLNPDGSLDVSFDPKGGLATLPDGFGNLSPVYSLALQLDGKILVRGSFDSVNGLNYTNFVRLNTDGSVDTHFLPDAAAQARGFYDRGGAMAVQPDGKILVAEAGDCCGIKPVKLGRLAADGSSYPTFVTLEVVGASSGWGSTFNVIVVEGDGSVLFEGNVDPAPPNIVGPGQGMTRLNADGSIDESFHPVMDRLIDGDGGSRNAAVVQPDAKIVIAGLFNQVNGVDRPGLARLNSDGSTDASFVPENNDADYRYFRPLALQADGKLLVSFGDGSSIVRLNADGSLDLTFELGAKFAFDFGVEQNGVAGSIWDIIVQPDGLILVAGKFTSANGIARSGLVRLNGDAHLANSPARFRSITGAGTGQVQLNLDVVPNRTYAIEASTDLINWTAITTANATNYWLNVTDSAAGISRRFYRAVQTAP